MKPTTTTPFDRLCALALSLSKALAVLCLVVALLACKSGQWTVALHAAKVAFYALTPVLAPLLFSTWFGRRPGR